MWRCATWCAGIWKSCTRNSTSLWGDFDTSLIWTKLSLESSKNSFQLWNWLTDPIPGGSRRKLDVVLGCPLRLRKRHVPPFLPRPHGQRQDHAGPAMHEQLDADQQANDPEACLGPPAPEEDTEDQIDDPVEQDPRPGGVPLEE